MLHDIIIIMMLCCVIHTRLNYYTAPDLIGINTHPLSNQIKLKVIQGVSLLHSLAPCHIDPYVILASSASPIIMVVMHMHTSESVADTDGCCLRLPPLLFPVCACIMMLSLILYQNLVADNYKFISTRLCNFHTRNLMQHL